MPQNTKIPIVTVSSRDLAAMREAGLLLLRHQNVIVGVAEPVPHVSFERGATEEEIRDAWTSSSSTRP